MLIPSKKLGRLVPGDAIPLRSSFRRVQPVAKLRRPHATLEPGIHQELIALLGCGQTLRSDFAEQTGGLQSADGDLDGFRLDQFMGQMEWA